MSRRSLWAPWSSSLLLSSSAPLLLFFSPSLLLLSSPPLFLSSSSSHPLLHPFSPPLLLSPSPPILSSSPSLLLSSSPRLDGTPTGRSTQPRSFLLISRRWRINISGVFLDIRTKETLLKPSEKQNPRLTRGLSAERRPLFVPGC